MHNVFNGDPYAGLSSLEDVKKRRNGRCLYTACGMEATHTYGKGLKFCRRHARNATTILGKENVTWDILE